MATLDDYAALIDAAGYDLSQLTTSVRDKIINQARKRIIREHRWSWLETRDTATLVTVAGNPEVSLTPALSSLAHVDAVRFKRGNDEFPTIWVPYQQLRDMEVEDTWVTGWAGFEETYWSRHGNKLRFYPVPDAVYQLQIEYITQPSDLSGLQVDVIPDRLSDLVVWATISFLAFRQRDTAAQQAAENTYSYLTQRAVMQDNTPQRQSSRQVRSGYWES